MRMCHPAPMPGHRHAGYLRGATPNGGPRRPDQLGPDPGDGREPGTTMNSSRMMLGHTRPAARRRPEGLATAVGAPRPERDPPPSPRMAADRTDLVTDRVAARMCRVGPRMIGLWIETGAWPLPHAVCATSRSFRLSDVKCWIRTGTWPAGVPFRSGPDSDSCRGAGSP